MTPTAAEWISGIPSVYLVFLVLSTIATVVVIALAFIHLYAIHYYVRSKEIRSELFYLCMMFPIVALTSLLGMYFVRSAIVLNAIGYIYVMFSLVFAVMLLFDIFGGYESFVKYLLRQKQCIQFDISPLCCCFRCLQSVQSNKKNLRYVKWLTTQSPYVRIILEIIDIIAFFEGNAYPTLSIILNILKVISMLFAVYGCFILLALGKEKSEGFRIIFIFGFVNLTQVCLTLQMLIFESIGSFGTSDESLLNSNSAITFYNNAIITYEMCVMSILATIFLHPRKSALFDKYQLFSSKVTSIVNSFSNGYPSVTSM